MPDRHQLMFKHVVKNPTHCGVDIMCTLLFDVGACRCLIVKVLLTGRALISIFIGILCPEEAVCAFILFV